MEERDIDNPRKLELTSNEALKQALIDYVTADGLTQFLLHNDLEDLREQKYRSPDEVRRDYPNIVRLFRNASFPPNLVQGLAAALDASIESLLGLDPPPQDSRMSRDETGSEK